MVFTLLFHRGVTFKVKHVSFRFKVIKMLYALQLETIRTYEDIKYTTGILNLIYCHLNVPMCF